MKRAHPALGIDLGTTNSAVAFVDSTGRPETIRNAEGGLSTPSVIFFDRDNPVIGIEVVEAGEEPERLGTFAKRWGTVVCHDLYEVAAWLQVQILRKLKDDAEQLGQLEKAVIVPAFFNESCRSHAGCCSRT